MCHHTHPKAPVLSDFSLIFHVMPNVCVETRGYVCHDALVASSNTQRKFIKLNGRKLTSLDFPSLTLHKLQAAANSITVTAITTKAMHEETYFWSTLLTQIRRYLKF